MASPNNAPRSPDIRDQSLRREALEHAVRFASGPNTSATTDQVVNTAKSFYEFLKGERDGEEN